MTKKELGIELKNLLAKETDIVKISRWALKIDSTYRDHFDAPTLEILQCLFSMEDDPQFELSLEELKKISEKLIFDGEKEELSEPISEIKDKAEDLGEGWLLCPLCQEAWQSSSTYGMIICPKCNHKLHNPKVKTT